LAQINAEIRREKAKLKAQIPDLVKLSKKKARKLPEEKKKERAEKIEKIDTDIDAIPDGTAPDRARRREKLLAQAGPININVGAFTAPFAFCACVCPITCTRKAERMLVFTSVADVSNMQLNPLSMEHSEESTAFRNEFLKSKQKQDEGLDHISKGLRTLKDLSSAMSDELKKQDPLLDSIEHKTNDATSELRTANTKLKKLLLEMRQPHKLCLDLILISVLLGIGSYIFTLAKPSTTAKLKSTVSDLKNKLNPSPPPAAHHHHRRHVLHTAAPPMLPLGGDSDLLPGMLNDPAGLRLLR
jgi:syntaxin of plants SYP7